MNKLLETKVFAEDNWKFRQVPIKSIFIAVFWNSFWRWTKIFDGEIATSTPKELPKLFFIYLFSCKVDLYYMRNLDSFNVDLWSEQYEEFCFWGNHYKDIIWSLLWAQFSQFSIIKKLTLIRLLAITLLPLGLTFFI